MSGTPDTWAGQRATSEARARRWRSWAGSPVNRVRLAALVGVVLFSVAVWGLVIWALIRIL